MSADRLTFSKSAPLTMGAAAAITPPAIRSHRTIPPKILTRIPFTFGSEVMILNAAATFSLLALPPTSRKFAGSIP